jgi:hypothetical protein
MSRNLLGFECMYNPTENILDSPGDNAFGPLSPVTVTIVDKPLVVLNGYNFVFCVWIVFSIGFFLAANIDCVVAAVLGLHDVGAIVLLQPASIQLHTTGVPPQLHVFGAQVLVQFPALGGTGVLGALLLRPAAAFLAAFVAPDCRPMLKAL